MKIKLLFFTILLCLADISNAQLKVKLEDNSNASNFTFNNGKIGLGISNANNVFCVKADGSGYPLTFFENSHYQGSYGIVMDLKHTYTLDADYGENAAFIRGIENTTTRFWIGSKGNAYFGGNVGIGTTNPFSKLQVNGNTYISNASIGRSGGHYDEFGYNIGFTNTSDSYTYRVTDFAASIRMGWNGAIEFRTAPNGAQGSTLALSERMKITQSGNVGIGITDPAYKLMVQGEIHINRDYPYVQFNSSFWNSSSFIQTGVTSSGQVNGDYMVFYNPSSKGFNFRQGTNDVFTISPIGNVGIGTTTPSTKLTVKGKILASEVQVVDVGTIPDYVFKPGYKLMTLPEVEKFVKTHNHLPDVPSEQEFKEKGMNMAEMNNSLLKKVEELTLYMIEKDKEIAALKMEKNVQLVEQNKINKEQQQMLLEMKKEIELLNKKQSNK